MRFARCGRSWPAPVIGPGYAPQGVPAKHTAVGRAGEDKGNVSKLGASNL